MVGPLVLGSLCRALIIAVLAQEIQHRRQCRLPFSAAACEHLIKCTRYGFTHLLLWRRLLVVATSFLAVIRNNTLNDALPPTWPGGDFATSAVLFPEVWSGDSSTGLEGSHVVCIVSLPPLLR